MVTARNYAGEDVEVPERPLRSREYGGCTCPLNKSRLRDDDPYFNIQPTCDYHNAAAAQPWNHTIPWNCPTYWDGCNCEGGPYLP